MVVVMMTMVVVVAAMGSWFSRERTSQHRQLKCVLGWSQTTNFSELDFDRPNQPSGRECYWGHPMA